MGFYFQIFKVMPRHGFDMLRHDLKKLGFVKGLHATAQGEHAAACCSQDFVWGLSMPRHDETMPRHDSVFMPLVIFAFLALVQYVINSPKTIENHRVMHLHDKNTI